MRDELEMSKRAKVLATKYGFADALLLRLFFRQSEAPGVFPVDPADWRRFLSECAAQEDMINRLVSTVISRQDIRLFRFPSGEHEASETETVILGAPLSLHARDERYVVVLLARRNSKAEMIPYSLVVSEFCGSLARRIQGMREKP